MRVVRKEMGIEKAAVESNFHLHCYTCINFQICLHKKIDVNCSVGPCPLKCGFIFHQCKLLEHRMLCANEKVPCINYVNGCPVVIVRHKMAKHLETCPANVVVCTAEWNRWPAYYKKQLSHIPVQGFRKGQLDVDMLLRDQRALNDWLKTPLKYRKYFCNNLTPDLPPVPVPFVSQKVQVTLPPVCNKANEDFNHVQQYSLVSEQQHMRTFKINTLCEELSELVPSIMSQKYQSDETNEGISNEEKELKSAVFFRNSANGSEICSVPNKLLIGDSVPEPPQDPPLPPLCLNIMIESISRHQHKPRNMYTFVCAQFFRRDEYAGHYKDVHCEIQCGLNGWLEHRCPLAHYGCPFSLRRLYPSIKGLKITYSEEQESFAIKQRNSEEHILSNSQVELSTFPSEVLLHICHFLDSFSLSSLSMTCTRMQDVCSSLLVERGIVVLPWEKTTESKLSWKQTEKKWLFSTAFTPVRVWGLEDEGNMSNHLLKCSYNDRVVNEKPYTHFKSCIPVGNSSLIKAKESLSNITTKQ